ncbi:MAG: hypothetical protein AAF220_06355 [Pseudomonadota bacterium]
MIVDEVRSLLQDQGETGRMGAIAYARGVFDGILRCDQAYHMARNLDGDGADASPLMLRLQKLTQQNPSAVHPAQVTEALVLTWLKEGRPPNVPFADVALAYLRGEIG